VREVTIRRLNNVAEVGALRAEINALNLASPRPDPFSTFEYCESLWRRGATVAGSDAPRMWFLAAFAGRELIGYAALEQVTGRVLGLRTSRLWLIGGFNADRPHVVASAANITVVTERLYRYLHEHRREWDLLEFQQQDSTSTLYPLPPGVSLGGCWVGCWPNLENGTIRIRWSSLRQYFEALSSKFGVNLKRQVRRLLERGDVELLTSSDPSVTPALLELYCMVEKRSWKAGSTLTIGGDAGRLRHYQALLEARQPMQAMVQILLLDGMPAAGLIGGSFDGPVERALYALEVAFDRQLAPEAPGSALLLMGMRHAIGGGYTSFNLLSGFGYYKTRWLADMTATRCVQIYRVGSLLFWRRMLGDAYRRLAAYLPSRLQGRLPSGRAVEIDAQLERRSVLAPAHSITVAERATAAELIGRARLGVHEWLTKKELVAALPFDVAPQRSTRQPSSAPAASRHQRVKQPVPAVSAVQAAASTGAAATG
jgi:hypothetical protein